VPSFQHEASCGQTFQLVGIGVEGDDQRLNLCLTSVPSLLDLFSTKYHVMRARPRVPRHDDLGLTEVFPFFLGLSDEGKPGIVRWQLVYRLPTCP
jgi:hypothetical protein